VQTFAVGEPSQSSASLPAPASLPPVTNPRATAVAPASDVTSLLSPSNVDTAIASSGEIDDLDDSSETPVD
jgi:hypothetical protein